MPEDMTPNKVEELGLVAGANLTISDEPYLYRYRVENSEVGDGHVDVFYEDYIDGKWVVKAELFHSVTPRLLALLNLAAHQVLEWVKEGDIVINSPRD